MENPNNLKKAQKKEQDPMSQLTPQQRKEVEDRKKLFKQLLSCFDDYDLIEAIGVSQQTLGLIDGKFMASRDKTKVQDLDLLGEAADKRGKKILEVLAQSTVGEAVYVCGQIGNAIEHYKNLKVEDLKVKDLGIKVD